MKPSMRAISERLTGKFGAKVWIRRALACLKECIFFHGLEMAARLGQERRSRKRQDGAKIFGIRTNLFLRCWIHHDSSGSTDA